jgi:hypothetical protein
MMQEAPKASTVQHLVCGVLQFLFYLGYLWLFSEELTGGERTNVTIHEMGHAVGLAHRLTENVLMNGDTYDDVFDPDDVDFRNLLVIYGSQE